MEDPETFRKASFKDLSELLFALYRADRLNESLLFSRFEDGTILRILKRLKELHNTHFAHL